MEFQLHFYSNEECSLCSFHCCCSESETSGGGGGGSGGWIRERPEIMCIVLECEWPQRMFSVLFVVWMDVGPIERN